VASKVIKYFGASLATVIFAGFKSAVEIGLNPPRDPSVAAANMMSDTKESVSVNVVNCYAAATVRLVARFKYFILL
jgi:hypothetical protein